MGTEGDLGGDSPGETLVRPWKETKIKVEYMILEHEFYHEKKLKLK